MNNIHFFIPQKFQAVADIPQKCQAVVNNASKRFRIRRLLQKSHISVFHDQNPPNWLTNATVVRIKVPPLKTVFGKLLTRSPTNTSYLPTVGKHSYFEIINRKKYYNLCDVVEVRIVMKNGLNITKSHGGDYMFASIHSRWLKASSNPERGVIDHQNGSYTASFKLRWTGRVRINVTLVHSSEAVSVLQHMRDYLPARQAFDGIFRQGNEAKLTPCHVTPLMFVKSWENTSTEVNFCNFTDPVTGSPWYCAKPMHSPCSSYSQHAGSQRGNEVLVSLVNKMDRLVARGR